MIWSPVAINYKEGVWFHPDGTIRANEVGAWVMSVEEAREALEARR